MDFNGDYSSSCISLLQTDLFPNAPTIKTRFSEVCSSSHCTTSGGVGSHSREAEGAFTGSSCRS